LDYVNGGRFDPDFIKHRRLGLQWFMDRISRHPLLQKSSSTRMFLESVDFVMKKPDQKFEGMKNNVEKFEDSLNAIERLYLRIGKRQQELEQNYDGFAASIQGLSRLEQKMNKPLEKFAEAADTYVESLKEMRQQQNLLFLNDVHELINYCSATREQLDIRDQKQVDFEELSSNLQSLTAERERLLDPSKSNANMGIAEFMADKMNDTGRGKSERIIRLELRINQLQKQVIKANDDNNRYSEQIIKECEIFQKTGQRELKQGLASYADCHIDYYKKGLSIWENILPVLNEM
ncbi:hypothetical protein K501DRAFT_309394, partial [Backusella circina FSU 941]